MNAFVFIAISCFLFTNAEKTQTEIIHVPYVYNHGEKEIDLFLSFNCHFCRAALENLAKYIKTQPKIRAKIYFFIQNPADKPKLIWLIATEQNLDALLELHEIFLNSHNQKPKLVAFLKKYPQIANNIKQYPKLYTSYANAMQRKFIQARVDCTPTWLINDEIMINGIIDEIDKLISSTLK